MQYIAKLKQHETLQTQSVEQCGTSCNCRIQSERGLEVMAICRRWLCGFAYMSDFVWIYEDWAFAGHMDMHMGMSNFVKRFWVMLVHIDGHVLKLMWDDEMWVFPLQGHAVLCPFNHARDGILCYPVRLGRNSQQACRRGRKAACHDKVEPDSCERMIWSALRCIDAYSSRTCSSLPQSHPATSYSIISTSTCLHGRTMIAAFLDRQVSTALQMALLNCCVTGQNLKASATGTREP